MINRNDVFQTNKRISLLLIAESPTIGSLLRGVFQQNSLIAHFRVAKDIPEALYMLRRTDPDVILLDPAMSFKEDMTLLQHIMTHQPTPTILLPSSEETEPNKVLVTLQTGAVDSIWQEEVIEKVAGASYRKQLFEKIVCSSQLDVTSFQVSSGSGEIQDKESTKKVNVIFCEECGERNLLHSSLSGDNGFCARCGDDLTSHLITKYRRTHYVTIIAAGTGSCSNLLRIIPRVPAKIRGAVIIVLHSEEDYVDTFTHYLDNISKIKIHRAYNGISIEGGSCYVTTAAEKLYMKPYSTNHSMAIASSNEKSTPVDLLMRSVSRVFKNNTAGLILSGVELDGDVGLNAIKDNNGTTAVLYGANCLYRQMGENALRKCEIDKIVNEFDATGFIYALHNVAGESKVTS